VTTQRPGGKVVAIIQARMSSSRLPRKVALEIHGKCLLERVIGQVRRARTVDEIAVVTSTSPDDEIVAMICRRLSVDCHRGSLSDVRSRFVAAGRERGAAIVVRVTADNPLTEPAFIDAVVEALENDPAMDYATMNKERIPDGSGAEAFRMQALLDTLGWDDADYSREHVTPALRGGKAVRVVEPALELDLGDYFVGIDTFENYLHIQRLFGHYGDDPELLKKLISDVRRERAEAGRASAAGGV
jgi:spore coat polysaccharide biosynthesis protein SpsF (cytidylyltransferase family)